MNDEGLMPDKIEGALEVGPNDRGEVVINLPRDMTGHIVFSPNQARHLAEVLLYHAAEIDGQQSSNTAVEMRRVLERIASRRPVTEKAAQAFYRSRREAKEFLLKQKARA